MLLGMIALGLATFWALSKFISFCERV